MQSLEIRVDGREILGAPRDRQRPSGFIVKPGGFQGWQGLPAGRREALARAVEHGEHDVPVFLPARVVTIDAWVISNSVYELGHMGDNFVGIGATGARTRMTVALQGKNLYADGRRVLAEFDDSAYRNGHEHGEAQLQMVFADPRKYGTTNVLPGSELVPPDPTVTATQVDVFSRGNFPAYPVIEIPSAPASYTISSPGGTYTVTGATSGGLHSVDLRRGRVFRNGVEMPGVGRGDLWTVPVGAIWPHTLSVPGRVRIPDTSI